MKGKMLLKGKHILSSLLIVTLVALNVSGGPQANVVRGASETYKPYTNLEEDYKFVWVMNSKEKFLIRQNGQQIAQKWVEEMF